MLKKIFILVIILMIILLGTQVKANLVLQDIVAGTWQVSSIKENGKELTSDDTMMVDFIIGGTITLDLDGKYTCEVPALELLDIPNTGKYETQGENKVKVTYGDGETGIITYNEKADTLVLNYKGYVATAIRITGLNKDKEENKETIVNDNNKINQNTEKKPVKDNTTSSKKLPQTGKGMTITVVLSIAIVLSICLYKKYKNIEIC